MTSWGYGYVTDIEYAEGFYPDQAPAHLALAATLGGVQTPELDGHFTYCELGCGRGRTSLVLAAINPQAEFHAIDFNPAHIAHARQQARRAGLKNIQFHECSFAELAGPRGAALPKFDVVTMHGVWSWVAPELQSAIAAFLNVGLNPGGLVYVSYNALPAWSLVAQVQRLVKELADASKQRSDIAILRAVEQIERFAEAKIIPARFDEGIKRLQKGRNSMVTYLAHEYLNDHWRPLYFADVARAFAAAKLEFCAGSDLLKNFNNLALNEQQRALLAEISQPDLRETLKDFCTDHWFRQDIFVRGMRRMTAARREKLLTDQTLALLRPTPDVFEIGKPDGSRWRPDEVVYRAVFRALEIAPRTVHDLLTLDGLPKDHLVGAVELVGTLVGTGIAAPYREPSAAELAGAAGLNALLDPEDEISLSHGTAIAAPALRTGLTLSPANYLLYRSLKHGAGTVPEDLAAEFIRRCREGGGHPVIDDKVIEDDAEAHAKVTKDYETKIEELTPIWRMTGIL
jgi:SAM-dependent methyltransferase